MIITDDRLFEAFKEIVSFTNKPFLPEYDVWDCEVDVRAVLRKLVEDAQS